MGKEPKPDKPSIWIDLDNSPHVPLFVPLIEHYRQSGVEVILTARDHAQTVGLLELAKLSGTYTKIGRHAGAGAARKIFGLFERTFQLVRFIRGCARPSVALSHGSRAMVLAAKLLGIPVVTMYDYEFTETRIFNRFSDRVLVPDAIEDRVLDTIGLSAAKTYKYRGLKEELYIRGFEPKNGFADELAEKIEQAIPLEKVIVVVRPPATSANYHVAESDLIFESLLELLSARDDVFAIVSPRTKQQQDAIEAKIGADNTVILASPVNGLDLLNFADMVVSGGGTMNREAALLGVPVFSIFQGEQGSLDRRMEASGDITFIRSPEDLKKVAFLKRDRTVGGNGPGNIDDRVEVFVRKHIDSYLFTGKTDT